MPLVKQILLTRSEEHTSEGKQYLLHQWHLSCSGRVNSICFTSGISRAPERETVSASPVASVVFRKGKQYLLHQWHLSCSGRVGSICFTSGTCHAPEG
jgi:hypothetical protein